MAAVKCSEHLLNEPDDALVKVSTDYDIKVFWQFQIMVDWGLGQRCQLFEICVCWDF